MRASRTEREKTFNVENFQIMPFHHGNDVIVHGAHSSLSGADNVLSWWR